LPPEVTLATDTINDFDLQIGPEMRTPRKLNVSKFGVKRFFGGGPNLIGNLKKYGVELEGDPGFLRHWFH
jgi:hypothetical protein